MLMSAYPPEGQADKHNPLLPQNPARASGGQEGHRKGESQLLRGGLLVDLEAETGEWERG